MKEVVFGNMGWVIFCGDKVIGTVNLRERQCIRVFLCYASGTAGNELLSRSAVSPPISSPVCDTDCKKISVCVLTGIKWPRK